MKKWFMFKIISVKMYLKGGLTTLKKGFHCINVSNNFIPMSNIKESKIKRNLLHKITNSI